MSLHFVPIYELYLNIFLNIPLTITKIELLQHVSLFSALNRTSINKLCFFLATRTYSRGQKILREGEWSDSILFIQSGECKIVKNIHCAFTSLANHDNSWLHIKEKTKSKINLDDLTKETEAQQCGQTEQSDIKEKKHDSISSSELQNILSTLASSSIFKNIKSISDPMTMLRQAWNDGGSVELAVLSRGEFIGEVPAMLVLFHNTLIPLPFLGGRGEFLRSLLIQ